MSHLKRIPNWTKQATEEGVPTRNTSTGQGGVPGGLPEVDFFGPLALGKVGEPVAAGYGYEEAHHYDL